MTGIPTVETERLILRGYRLDDFPAHAAFWADPEVTKFIGGRPFSREEAWARYLRYAGMWQVMGFGFWAVTDRRSGNLIGSAGFHDLKRELVPSIEGTMETGWSLSPSVQGKGIGSELVGAMMGWADTNRPEMRVTCLIDPDNAPSLRLAEKHGFREFARTDYHGNPVILFERHRPGGHDPNALR